MDKYYLAIDLKSFYASYECVSRGLDPLTTNLVVADESRTDKTICLAISPSLKKYGLPGRERLFKVKQFVKKLNNERKKNNHIDKFIGKSSFQYELDICKDLEIDFIIAPPRMKKYMEMSSKIYNIYLKYVSKDDIHVYSIDEVFIDVTSYLKTYHCNAKELGEKIVNEVFKKTKITATCGVGTNMYLAKVAMDILAKHVAPNENGVRIAYLDEQLYKEQLWEHTPLTDFWRIGKGIEKRLNKLHIYNQGDLAIQAYLDEDVLYKEFGINAELLIDHAFGVEPVEMKDIKNYVPISNSTSIGQVLHKPYSYDKGLIIVKEMSEALALQLFSKKILTKQLMLAIGYDVSSIKDDKDDFFTHGLYNFKQYTNTISDFKNALVAIYHSICDEHKLIRRINVSASSVLSEEQVSNKLNYEQLSLFEQVTTEKVDKKEDTKKEKDLMETLLKIKNKYGANSIIKGIDLEEDATTIERNEQVGGHKG
ncbi:MAG: DNA methylase [Bacilli bacterium]